MENIIHYPSLKTVLMVEEALQKAELVLSKEELKDKLPKKIMHQTLNVVLDYLANSRKIIMHGNKILWIWNPKATKMHEEKQFFEMTPEDFRKMRKRIGLHKVV